MGLMRLSDTKPGTFMARVSDYWPCFAGSCFPCGAGLLQAKQYVDYDLSAERWASASFGVGILFADGLNQFCLPVTGFPLSFGWLGRG
jgi:hypothetical protein